MPAGYAASGAERHNYLTAPPPRLNGLLSTQTDPSSP